MSRFRIEALSGLQPYVPGEQLNETVIKLNTNENPYPPSKAVLDAINSNEIEKLKLYSDPSAHDLRMALAKTYGLKPTQIFTGNGSDEVLGFAFMAFGDKKVTFPKVSYGFYKVFAQLFRIPTMQVPLNDDFSLPIAPFANANSFVVIANPNAPTSLSAPLEGIEEIIKGNADNVVIIDEAYIDFGGESAIPLLEKYENLLVVRTFSKSRSLAGARIGYAMGNEALIADLDAVRNSFHPYNINRLSLLAGVAALSDVEYFEHCLKQIIDVREETTTALRELGFEVLNSSTNFLFVSHKQLSGTQYYKKLREYGVLIRHWGSPELENYVRISIGTREEMKKLIEITKILLMAKPD